MKTQYIVLPAVFTAFVLACAVEVNAAPAVHPAELIALLKSNSPKSEKVKAFKPLAVFGSKDAVPAIAPYLADEELSSWARIALEAIPDPACDEALREAEGTLKGRLLIGVINSLGVRRDARAVGALAKRLGNADEAVAAAAAASLGRIGGEAATQALEKALAGARAPSVTRSPMQSFAARKRTWPKETRRTPFVCTSWSAKPTFPSGGFSGGFAGPFSLKVSPGFPGSSSS